MQGLSPADKASKAELLRRLSLDLIGLSPSAQEFADFDKDDSKDAYENK